MRASDVVTQLAVLLPQLTNAFTTEVAVRSLARSGTTVTATCDDPHNLEPGHGVNISGAVVPIPISDLSRSGTTGTLVTSTAHDLTEAVAPTVEIEGANEAVFNDTFDVIEVVNRKTITFTMADAGATSGTGSPVLLGAESALRNYNTLYQVLETPTPTKFTFVHSVTSLPNPVGTLVARIRPRISVAVTPDRAVDSYTKQGVGEFWLFVVLEDVFASKDRGTMSDAVAFQGRGAEFRQQVVQPFSLYLFVPVSSSLSGQSGRDQAEDLFRPICKSLLFSRFDSGLYSENQGTVQFVSHGTFRYDSATYIHAFSFQQVVDLTFEDTVGPDLDVAFRDIALTLVPQLGGTETLVSSIDLDDEPLP